MDRGATGSLFLFVFSSCDHVYGSDFLRCYEEEIQEEWLDVLRYRIGEIRVYRYYVYFYYLV